VRVTEAINNDLCSCFHELYLWSNKKLRKKRGRLAPSTAPGLPGLDGEHLQHWHDFDVADDGAIRQFSVFSFDQLKRSKDAVTALADARRKDKPKGLTDVEVIKKHPDLFRRDENQAARERGERTSTYNRRPTKNRRKKKADARDHASKFSYWRNHCCRFLGRKLNFWDTDRGIENDPKDIDTIVRKLREMQETEWLGPDGKTAYYATWYVEKLGVAHQHLGRFTKRGMFHPLWFDRASKAPSRRGRVLGWPKEEIHRYLTDQKGFRETPKAADPPTDSTGQPAPKHGPAPDPDTEAMSERCYREYVTNHQSRKDALKIVRENFPENAPSSPDALKVYARRYACRHGLPWRQ
jgi:hypothetical protein